MVFFFEVTITVLKGGPTWKKGRGGGHTDEMKAPSGVCPMAKCGWGMCPVKRGGDNVTLFLMSLSAPSSASATAVAVWPLAQAYISAVFPS